MKTLQVCLLLALAFTSLAAENAQEETPTFLGNFKQLLKKEASNIEEMAIHYFEKMTGHHPKSKNLTEEYPFCEVCNAMVAAGRYGMDSAVFKAIAVPIAIEVCHRYTTNHTICPEMIDEMADIVVDSYAEHIFRPHYTCGKLGYCAKDYKVLNLTDYINETLYDKPNKTLPTPSGKDTYTILHISDIHLDLNYTEGTDAFCNEPYCCRPQNGIAANDSVAAKKWGTLEGHCDIPLRTVQQMVEKLKKLKIDLVLWTGDNISHDLWYQNQQDQLKNTKDIAIMLKEALPNAQVVASPGNHECYPVNQCDFSEDSYQWFKKGLTDAFAPFLDDQAREELLANGFYTQYFPDKNLRVISYNSEVGDSGDYYLLQNPTDPSGFLEWLYNRLLQCEKDNENVFLIAHIPAQGTMVEWSARFNALMDRFAYIIRGTFFGHTHSENLHISRSYIDGTPVSVQWVQASMTTYEGKQPSFRVFTMDKDTNLPLDYAQYRLNLTKYNAMNVDNVDFDLAYNFLEEYSCSDMSLASVDDLAERISKNTTLASLYETNHISGTHVVPVKEDQLHNIFCGIKYGNPISLAACRGDPPPTDGIDGDWYIIDDDVEAVDI